MFCHDLVCWYRIIIDNESITGSTLKYSRSALTRKFIVWITE